MDRWIGFRWRGAGIAPDIRASAAAIKDQKSTSDGVSSGRSALFESIDRHLHPQQH